jgi:hypothetical protein
MERSEIRLELQGLPVTGDGLLKLAQFFEGSGQVVVDTGGVRLQLQSPLVAGNGFHDVPLDSQGDPQITVSAGPIRLQLEGTPVVGNRDVVPVYLVGKIAQEMECLDMIGLDRQDLAVNLFGGLQLAGLMVLHGKG